MEERNKVSAAMAPGTPTKPFALMNYVEYERMDHARQRKVWDLQNAPGLPPSVPKTEQYDMVMVWGCTLATVAELVQLAAPFVARRILVICNVPVPELGALNNEHSTVTITKKILA